MREPYVRPPLVVRPGAPRWVAVWRFRLLLLLLMLALCALGWLAYDRLIATEQDPGIPAPAATPNA